MRRNMQNLSFLAIIGALLICAFFFSQQSKTNLQSPLPHQTESMQSEEVKPISTQDIPDCTDLESEEEILTCYTEAASLSAILLDIKMDAILEMETDSQNRMDFMEIQLAWEESRDADCDFVQNKSQQKEESEVNQLICLRDHNLDRYEQLQSYYCQWYDPSSCED